MYVIMKLSHGRCGDFLLSQFQWHEATATRGVKIGTKTGLQNYIKNYVKIKYCFHILTVVAKCSRYQGLV